ncbi:hypothetical protein SLE2022_200190 [Rubroshorea leprosula]
MGYCQKGYCYCGRCKSPRNRQPCYVLLLLVVALILLSFSSLIKFEITVEAGQQFYTFVLLITALFLLFLVCWLSSKGPCRQHCGCQKCSPWRGC